MLVLLYSIRVVGNANSANYTSIYDFGINISMKTLREMMDLIESAQAGVAEGSDELYQQAIRKYVQRVANNYLGGGNAHLYGANNFDSEMFGVDPKQAQQDFDALFPQYLKKLQGGEQLEETTPDAMAKIDDLFRK